MSQEAIFPQSSNTHELLNLAELHDKFRRVNPEIADKLLPSIVSDESVIDVTDESFEIRDDTDQLRAVGGVALHSVGKHDIATEILRKFNARLKELDPVSASAVIHPDVILEEHDELATQATVVERNWEIIRRRERKATKPKNAQPELITYEPYELDKTLDWQDRARCRREDPELFYPEQGVNTNRAIKVCKTCKVNTECLEYALANNEHFGIWGATTEKERRAMLRQRNDYKTL